MTTVAATEALTAANLWAEMQSGPYASQITALGAGDQAIANLLNDVNGAHNGPVKHAPIPTADFLAELQATELAALTSTQKLELQIETETGVVNIGAPSIQAWCAQTFANAPTSLAALTALATQTGSRSEVLFGQGVFVTAQQVNIARVNSGTVEF